MDEKSSGRWRRDRLNNKRRLLLSITSTVLGLLVACLALIRLYPYPSNFPAFPRITHTQSGADGDPINVVFVGTKEPTRCATSC